jgi:hypothetical protein
LHNYLMDSFDEQLENTQVDYHEIPTPKEGGGFNAKAQRDQFLGGGGKQPEAPSKTLTDAFSSVPFGMPTAETPNRDNERIEQRSKYRRALVERLVKLEQDAIQQAIPGLKKRATKATLRNHITGEVKKVVLNGEGLMETATLEAFWDSGHFIAPFNHSEEAQTVRNQLAKSAWDEHEEWLATLTDEERRIIREAPEYDQERIRINRKFRQEHPEAWRIAIHIGMDKRDRFGNSLPRDKNLWQEEIAAAQKETQKKESKTEAESADTNVKPNESTTEQVAENYTVTDAAGNNYPISLQGEPTVSKLVEALKSIGAGALATQVETLSREQHNLPALLSAAKITVTPFSFEKIS